MMAAGSITITPVLVANLRAEGEQNFDLAGIDMVGAVQLWSLDVKEAMMIDA
jgi:hypothetical protein